MLRVGKLHQVNRCHCMGIKPVDVHIMWSMMWIIRTHGDLQGVVPRSGKPLPPSEMHFPVAGGDACLWLDATARRAADRHTLIIVTNCAARARKFNHAPDMFSL